MKKMPDIMDFESFLLEKKTANAQREDTIADAVKKIKDEYGHNATEFIASAQKKRSRCHQGFHHPNSGTIY